MEKKINKWKESGKTAKIVKVLKDNDFKNRQLALKVLAELKDHGTIDSIKPLIYDPVKPVMQAAIVALQQFDISTEIKNEIKGRLLDVQSEESARAAKREENQERSKQEKEDYLTRKVKEMKFREVENEAKRVRSENDRQKRITDTLGRIIGGPR